jgi:hypothetical protein
MQNSRRCSVLRVTVREGVLSVTYVILMGYALSSISILGAHQRIPAGLLHDILKTGLVHAKFKVFGTKRLTQCVIFVKLARCVTFWLDPGLYGKAQGRRRRSRNRGSRRHPCPATCASSARRGNPHYTKFGRLFQDRIGGRIRPYDSADAGILPLRRRLPQESNADWQS